ncbi:hypothetical protein HanRHA438_Chr17g0814211 [Helianthus annuus]|nr:hypothetical protein HanIR_Chr17g0872351 [Helianthus annuus]KAJ0447637.1 hypothetical protein HanHA89_Chr17g0707571 [Helianthus annuus]KAJ0632540.1 hypothetical protein HanLR1_Chr17g0666221 [Helianthus annuus]KAJ0826430.1 hypothetical protein HanRHA438_Chr17g0814211 [Helianthus annuus]
MLICMHNLLLVLRAPTTTAASKKNDVEKAQSSKAKNIGGEKKGMRRSSDSWCDYVVVSDSLGGLAPAIIVRRPKPEPKDSADILPSNPEDPIDLESSPERLVRKKAGKRKQTDAEAESQPTKKIQRKKITRRGNLDAFISESVPGKCHFFASFFFISSNNCGFHVYLRKTSFHRTIVYG